MGKGCVRFKKLEDLVLAVRFAGARTLRRDATSCGELVQASR
jgi:hypothetical protein